MFVPYNCCQKSFEDYYIHQSGSGLGYYQGSPLQKGYGFGGLFRSLFRAVAPLFKSGAKAVGKQLFHSGVDVLNDISKGDSFKVATQRRLKEADSPTCVKSELDLFLIPPTQTAIENGGFIEYQPLANIRDGGTVEFNISGSGEDYMDLSASYLHLDTLRESCGIIRKQASIDGGVLWKVVRVNVVQLRRKDRSLRDPRDLYLPSP
ncbi:uncharacterized protein F54H12.2 [Trichonephila clavipes]|nr:uncharacterized protein F54H12.2 [Trichonephila clavipes]